MNKKIVTHLTSEKICLKDIAEISKAKDNSNGGRGRTGSNPFEEIVVVSTDSQETKYRGKNF